MMIPTGPNLSVRTAFAALLLPALLATARADDYCVVRLSATDGSETVELMTESALRSLQTEIQAEGRLYAKALAAARAAWENDPANTKPFPSSAIKRREAVAVGPPSKDEATASERLMRVQTRQAEKESEDAKKEAARMKARYKNSDRNAGSRAAKEKAKEAERDALDQRAVTLYEQELKKLTAAAPAAAP